MGKSSKHGTDGGTTIVFTAHPKRLPEDRCSVRVVWYENQQAHERVGEGDYIEQALGAALGLREVEFASGVDDYRSAICLHHERSFVADFLDNQVLRVH